MLSRFPNLFATRFYGALGLFACCLFACCLAGCDDIIEPDISGQPVVLLTPADSSRATSVVETFRWEAVTSARTYRIQLASPSFAAPTRAYRDSTVQQAYFTTSLSPGTYQWRVQALNGSYQSNFSPTRTLFLDTTTLLTGQVLQLGQPATGTVTNTSNVRFSWTDLPMALRYELHLSPNPRAGGPSALDTLIGNTTAVNVRLPRTSQVYQWKVRAVNARSFTESAVRTLEIDITPPTAPALVGPLASASFLALPITLTWTRSAVDVVRDSVFLYEANQSTVVHGFPRLSNTTSFTLVDPAFSLTSGTYYWALRSVDRASNAGPLSSRRPFVLQ